MALGQSKASLAKKHLDLADKAERAGRYHDALDALLEAAKYGDAVEKRGRLYYNIGAMLQRLGRLAKAVHYFERALQFVKRPERRALVQKRIDALVPKAFGAVEVVCVGTAMVSVGSMVPKPCPATWERVPVGTREVNGRTADGLVAKTTVTVVAAQRVNAELVFPGGVEIPFQARDGVVLVDGIPRGLAPMRIDDLAPGKHLVAIRLPGEPDATAVVQVQAGQRATLRRKHFAGLTDMLAKRQYAPWAWTAIGLGAVSLGVGAYFELEGLSEAERLCDDPLVACGSRLSVTERLGESAEDTAKRQAEAEAAEKEAVDHKNLGAAMLTAGGVLVVTGAVLFLLDDGDAPSPTTSGVQISPQRDGAAVVWWGTW